MTPEPRVQEAAVGASLVELHEVEEAARRLEGVAIPTPLLPSVSLSEEVRAQVRLKCESLQRTGSFKIRGAYNFISRLGAEGARTGVVTYSSGNHGQAVALAARLLGLRAVVVMPTTAPAVKREGAIRLGAEVVLEGTTSEERRRRAESLAAEQELVVVPPFDHPWIIAGQGTVGLEIARDWPEVDSLLVPVGGGGLASGCAAALRRLVPGVRLIGVEPRGAASMRAALDAGGPVTLRSIDTVADGLAPVRAGDLTFQHARAFLDDVVVVEDHEIREAAGFLLKRQKLVVEFSGAAAVAALRSRVVTVEGRRTAVVLSGANIDPGALKELL